LAVAALVFITVRGLLRLSLAGAAPL